MAFTALDVKKLREETDAPMMECKSALEEAEGDFDRAKDILREKGKASAGKKAGRETSAGRVAIVLSADGLSAGIAVVESETDFVSNNAGFIESVGAVAAEALKGSISEERMKELGDEIIAKFRENCVVKVAEQIQSDSKLAFYLHHDGTSGAVVMSKGEHAGSEAIRKVAVHIAWGKPTYLKRDELPQSAMEHEFKVELERAILEGKPQNIAENIAKGRVDKEFVKKVVLLEQPYYIDQGKTVQQVVSEEAKGTEIVGFKFYSIGV